jgi:diguanylate cyclase
MSREDLLSKLAIRLSHVAEGTDPKLDKLLDQLRHSLRAGINEADISRLSQQLARQMILLEENSSQEPAPAVGAIAAELAQSIKSLPLDKSHRPDVLKLAERVAGSASPEHLLTALRDVLRRLPEAIGDAGATKKSGGGVLGWLDKKGGKGDELVRDFMARTRRLLDGVLEHIDVLNGDGSETKPLRASLTEQASADALADLAQDAIDLLASHSARIAQERSTTQNFLGNLREELISVEQTILSVISDGDNSLERAEILGQQVSQDVRSMGAAAEAEDLNQLKTTLQQGLSSLSARVTDYVAVEKDSHEASKQKVADLNRKIQAMEAEATQLRGQVKAKQDLAVKDPLTGVYNRAGFEERIGEELARHKRMHTPLSLVFIDCNKFKEINDTFGHAAGDIVLVKVAETLTARARKSDVVARYGGDEFVVILPDTPVDGARHFASDACEKILNAGFNNNGEPLDVSISCGITQVREGDTSDTALHRADEAMYQAKKETGLKVVVAL